MNLGRSVFAQLISFLPDREFRRCVSRYGGDAETGAGVDLGGGLIVLDALTGLCQSPDAAGAPRVLTRFVLKYTLRAAHLELGGVDLDLAVEDDVLPLDRADMTQQVGVEREVRRGGKP